MTLADPFRVVVVDETAVVRDLLSVALEADPEISVVASVANGDAALGTLSSADIEAVVLDIEMPVMDGLTSLPLLIEARPEIQVIMTSTLTRENADISLWALGLGAADHVTKPSARDDGQTAAAFKRDLKDKIKALCAAKRARKTCRPTDLPAEPGPVARPALAQSIRLRDTSIRAPEAIAIASSTGGPQALLRLFRSMPDCPSLPILVTQHMPACFTALLADHIGQAAGRPCLEAQDGQLLQAGTIYVAPGGYHMEIARHDGQAVTRLNDGPQEHFCRPAADPMFRSLAKVYGDGLLAVVLTGMGVDGRLGAAAVTAAGGSVIAQDEASSVVWGMPGAVARDGLCAAVLPLDEIGPYITQLAMRSAA